MPARRFPRARRGTLVLTACATFAGCRDGVPPFTPPDREPFTGDTYQLTFGLGHDRDPRWSAGGDTLLYHTDLFGQLPRALGALAEIGRVGGVAVPILEDVQSLGEPLLATPAYSPDGERVAYMDLVRMSAVVPCAASRPLPPPVFAESCETPQPTLDSAVLRVRRFGETRSPILDPSVPVRFAGVDHNLRLGLPGPYVQRVFPFQQAHREDHAMLFRASWAPDGQRIVFSDGLRLRVWRVGEAMAPVVPGTDDGVSAAWSPDGAWIAFTRLERGDSAVNTCSCARPPRPPQLHERTYYEITARSLVLTRPDGSDSLVLGPGEDPAWSPDGMHLYVSRGNAIVRVALQGGAAVVVPNTSGGRMPAVSPDGRWLAFARRKTTGTQDYDIWIVSIAP